MITLEATSFLKGYERLNEFINANPYTHCHLLLCCCRLWLRSGHGSFTEIRIPGEILRFSDLNDGTILHPISFLIFRFPEDREVASVRYTPSPFLSLSLATLL